MIKDKNSRRDQMSIMTDVLLTMKEPRIVTHMMYATNLSYGQLKKYLTLLTNIGLAEKVKDKENQHLFRITKKGMIFVDAITNYGNYLEHSPEFVMG